MFGSAYKRTPWTDWNPFEYTENVRTVPLRKTSAFKGIDEIDAHILSACQKMGYQIVQTKKDTGSFLFFVDEETRAFRNIINKEVIQGIRRYRLPAGITMDNGVIQIAVIEKCYKSRKYKKMYQELYDILGL